MLRVTRNVKKVKNVPRWKLREVTLMKISVFIYEVCLHEWPRPVLKYKSRISQVAERQLMAYGYTQVKITIS